MESRRTNDVGKAQFISTRWRGWWSSLSGTAWPDELVGGRTDGLRCPAHQHEPLPEEMGNVVSVPIPGTASDTIRPPGPNGLKSLWAFLCLSAAGSWAIWLWPFERKGAFEIIVFNLRFDLPFNLTKLMIGICLPGLLSIAWTLAEGRARVFQMLSTLLKWRAPIKWYLFALAAPWVVHWISLGLTLLYFPSSHPRPSFVWFVKNLLLLVPFGPLWEELAWRAYALRKLQAHYSQLKSALIIGIYWATWHIPLWIVHLGLTKETGLQVMASGFVSVVAWAMVFSFLYNRTAQSLPVVILLHAAYDSATAAIFPTLQGGKLQCIASCAVLSVCLAAIVRRQMCKQHSRVARR